MTGQAPDEVRHAGTTYSLTAVEGDGLFDPAAHGLTPESLSSGCWRGFVCGYTVDQGRLLLDRLEIGLPAEQARTELFGRKPAAAGRRAMRPGTPTYRRLAAAVPFTGRMLLGDDYVSVMYLNMGFLPAWTFTRVTELFFDGGILVAAHDRSAELAEVRERLAAAGRQFRQGEQAERWIEQTFSLSYAYSWPEQ